MTLAVNKVKTLTEKVASLKKQNFKLQKLIKSCEKLYFIEKKILSIFCVDTKHQAVVYLKNHGSIILQTNF